MSSLCCVLLELGQVVFFAGGNNVAVAVCVKCGDIYLFPFPQQIESLTPLWNVAEIVKLQGFGGVQILHEKDKIGLFVFPVTLAEVICIYQNVNKTYPFQGAFICCAVNSPLFSGKLAPAYRFGSGSNTASICFAEASRWMRTSCTSRQICGSYVPRKGYHVITLTTILYP